MEMNGKGTGSFRLESLDALRGFNMFFITGGSTMLAALGVLVTGNADCLLAVQMRHVEWEGLRIFDLIFPLFLFITGVTFPFSAAGRMARGDGKRAVAVGILRRALLLVALGAVYENIQFMDWPHFRVWSVIGRIGVVWGAAAICTLYCRRLAAVVVVAANLAGWWLLLRLFPAPGAAAGADSIAEQSACLASWVDVNFLTTAHRFEGGLATIAILPTAFFGIWAGEYLKSSPMTGGKVLKMLAVAAAMIAVGVAWAVPSWGDTIVKNIWTGSYALVSGGISLGLLAAFSWAIDVLGWKKWSFFFKVIGMNSIAIYLIDRFVPLRSIGAGFIGKLAATGSAAWNAFAVECSGVALGWLVLWFFYRRRIFFKI
jgi:predicted acyltransferase